MSAAKTALILGASRGLGLALAEEWLDRGWSVIATRRGDSAGLDDLARRYPDALQVEVLDIVDLAAQQALRSRLDGRAIDVLFVNAGIAVAKELSPLAVTDADFVSLMVTNALSPMRAIEVFEDLVGDDGVMALMSSELGSIATNRTGYWQLYSASKAALNMLANSWAAQHRDDTRAVLLVAPGWVRTDMGGARAILGIADSIPKVCDVVEDSFGKPGLRYVDRFGHGLPW